MRMSLPKSSVESPRTMIPPPHPFVTAPPAARITTLSAPSVSHGGSRSPGYSSNSYSHSTSPSTASGGIPEATTHDGAASITSPTQISSASLNAQKRAYRQRRKDPSCDACRERKVKCDATETSACSECSSRNHKCQFTKETNRRMSSIKQVQDLQSQIAELTQLNSQLRTRPLERESLDIERADMKRRHSHNQRSPTPAPQRISAPIMTDFDHVRSNIRQYAQGVFSTPHQNRRCTTDFSMGLPELPSRVDLGRLSRYYLESIHEWYPALHWPTFQQEADKVYASRSFEGSSREWIGLFHAVLACGSLQDMTHNESLTQTKSSETIYFDIASKALTPWSHDLTLVYVQAALLMSIFAAESSMKSLGSMWLASAVRGAQELQICSDVDTRSALDGEVRRRLWWALYTRDRMTSLDLNRPMIINENDCDVPYPSPNGDRYTQFDNRHSQPNGTPVTGSVAIIQITRAYSRLSHSLKSSIIVSQSLQDLEELLQTKSLLLPEAYQIDSNAPLEVTALPTVFTLLSARFHLCRRNFTPLCRSSDRVEALDRCVSIARDTARYISRAAHNTSKTESARTWQARVAPMASNAICLHLWRCMLVLCLRGEYDAALMCLHLSNAIGSIRKVNVACGRNLVFFLDQILNRVRAGHGRSEQLERDEELMAYVSGDTQGSLEHSWIWAGADLSWSTMPQTSPRNAVQSMGVDEPMRDAGSTREPSSSPEHRNSHWDGWRSIEDMIRHLVEHQRARSIQPPTYYPPLHNPVKRVQLTPDNHALVKPVSSPSPAPSSTSRISIANII